VKCSARSVPKMIFFNVWPEINGYDYRLLFFDLGQVIASHPKYDSNCLFLAVSVVSAFFVHEILEDQMCQLSDFENDA
jgi:hypothetical protein